MLDCPVSAFAPRAGLPISLTLDSKAGVVDAERLLSADSELETTGGYGEMYGVGLRDLSMALPFVSVGGLGEADDSSIRGTSCLDGDDMKGSGGTPNI